MIILNSVIFRGRYGRLYHGECYEFIIAERYTTIKFDSEENLESITKIATSKFNCLRGDILRIGESNLIFDGINFINPDLTYGGFPTANKQFRVMIEFPLAYWERLGPYSSLINPLLQLIKAKLYMLIILLYIVHLHLTENYIICYGY